MDRQLERNETIGFTLAMFRCRACRVAGLGGGDYIEVRAQFRHSDRFVWRLGPNLTIYELKELTAYNLLNLLKDCATDLQKVASELRSHA